VARKLVPRSGDTKGYFAGCGSPEKERGGGGFQHCFPRVEIWWSEESASFGIIFARKSGIFCTEIINRK
jgi:hypothetical protein